MRLSLYMKKVCKPLKFFHVLLCSAHRLEGQATHGCYYEHLDIML